ncbi:MAG: SAM-dependent methyltransferase [Rhodocyclales bacterium]|nr:SAM-dependent methyltransferase [Rhodocyclales bacterium]
MQLKPAELPEPSADARAASEMLGAVIAAEIAARGGWISFARYMELALYEPGLGYYAGGTQKFGDHTEGGDFLTAPEITPLFAQTLARQVAQVMRASAPMVIEAGAGSGRLAADLLPALDALGCLPGRYRILELSGALRARQQATLAQRAPAYLDRVEWLDMLPEHLAGCLLGNEVLDAMPTHALSWREDGRIEEIGVAIEEGRLVEAARPATGTLLSAAQALQMEGPWRGELSLAVRAWIGDLSRRLERGALLLIDYGLPRHELYHPQRNGGSIRCHYRHRVHQDAFWYPGLSDITSHVDFTAVAEAGFDAGLEVLGYCSQANFLLNCGIGELLGEVGAGETVNLLARGAVNVLLSPNEMGELFKVIALGRDVPAPLLGFASGDKVHTL